MSNKEAGPLGVGIVLVIYGWRLGGGRDGGGQGSPGGVRDGGGPGVIWGVIEGGDLAGGLEAVGDGVVAGLTGR